MRHILLAVVMFASLCVPSFSEAVSVQAKRDYNLDGRIDQFDEEYVIGLACLHDKRAPQLVTELFGDVSAQRAAGLIEPLVTTVGAKVILPIIYKGQLDSDSGACQYSNCGPTSVAMVLDYFGTHQTTLAVRNVISGTTCGNTGITDLYSATRHFRTDLTCTRKACATRAEAQSWLETEVRARHPVIVLVYTGYFPCYDGAFGHFVVVRGISADGETVYIHDPYNTGEVVRKNEFSMDDFLDGWWIQIGDYDAMSVSLAGYNDGQAPTPTPMPFAESGGMAVIEAEHCDYQRVGNCQWWLEFGGTYRPGWVGEGYLHAEPDNGTTRSTDYTTLAPRLDYRVTFSAPGTYYLWARTQHDNTNEDTLHGGIDKTAPATAKTMLNSGAVGQWSWTGALSGGGRATIAVPSAGEHTVNLWMSEDGTRIDRFLLTTNSGFAPSGSGPGESARGPALPTATPPPTPPGYQLISQGKPATASTTYNQNYPASKAVDGNIGHDTDRWVSNNDTSHWLVVDLGGAYTLYEARVYSDEAYINAPGTGDQLWNVTSYHIRASNANTGDPRSWTELADYNDPCGAPYPDYPGDGLNAHNTHALSGVYRYVALHVDGGDGNCGPNGRVQEFQVFGVPASNPPTATPTALAAPSATRTNTVVPTNTQPAPSPTRANTLAPTPTPTHAPAVSPTPGATTCLGDADGNRFVNGDDFRIVRDHFGTSSCGVGDANGDCFVNGDDFRAVRDHFGSNCG